MEAKSEKNKKKLAQDIMDFKVHFIAYIAPKWIAPLQKDADVSFRACRKCTHEEGSGKRKIEKYDESDTHINESTGDLSPHRIHFGRGRRPTSHFNAHPPKHTRSHGVTAESRAATPRIKKNFFQM